MLATHPSLLCRGPTQAALLEWVSSCFVALADWSRAYLGAPYSFYSTGAIIYWFCAAIFFASCSFSGWPIPTKPLATVTVFPPRPAVWRVISTRPRFFGADGLRAATG